MTHHTDSTDPRHWLDYVPKTLHRSPLYSHLYARLREDPEIGEMLLSVDKDQPAPILFFSVVNFLLFGNTSHDLAQFYPHLTPFPRSTAQAYPSFRQFCLSHREELLSLLSGARLQTNEVTRCANLLPAFELVSKRGERRPLALLEIGASAGFNLNWNRFGYQYGSIVTGDLRSPVLVHCTLSGDHLPPLPETLPPVARCQGIERFPLSMQNEEDVRWLRACIWPEERTRYDVFDAAVRLARQYPPQIAVGDACELLPELLEAIPLEETVCLWHSFALNQGPEEVRERIEEIVVYASLARTIYRISLEVDPTQTDDPRLELFTYQRGACVQSEWLATCAIHGETMQWRVPASLEE